MATQLTSAQLTTLKANLAANTSTILVATVSTQIKDVPKTADIAPDVAAWYNLAAAGPNNVLWRKLVPLMEVGGKFNGTELGNLTAVNLQRLQTIGQYSPQGISAYLTDQRAFFADTFSTGGITAAALLALWKATASNIKKLFSTGTGSDASPLTTDSNLSDSFALTSGDVQAAWVA